MDLHEELVSEALFSEVANKGWSDFLKKYGNIDYPERYFVNFSDHGGSTEDKRFVGQLVGKQEKRPLSPGTYLSKDGKESVTGPTPHQKRHDKQAERRATPDVSLFSSPSHNDPVGIYTYPLKYVLDQGASIPYGRDLRYMRVLKARPGIKVLKLNDIKTKEQSLEILRKMGVFDVVDRENTIWGNAAMAVEQSYTGNTDQPSKIFFYIFQHSYGKLREGDPVFGDSMKIKFLPGHEQTARLRKVGYDLVVDEATSKEEATIHPNEPTQAFFVNRGAFDIVDVFEVTQTKKNTKGDKNKLSAYSVEGVSARIVNSIADALNDKVMRKLKWVHGSVEHSNTEDKNVRTDQRNVFVTKRGRMISVDSRMSTSENLPSTAHVPVISHVELKGEHGRVSEVKYPKDSIKDFVEYFIGRYKAQPIDPRWQPMRGDVNKGEQLWRAVINQVSKAVKHTEGVVNTGMAGGYHVATTVDLKYLSQMADYHCQQMAEALSHVGWNWTPPTKWYDKLGAWIVMEKFHNRMNAAAGRPTPDFVSRAVEKFRTVDGTHSATVKRIDDDIKDPEKNTAAKTFYQAVTLDAEAGIVPSWWDGLLTGLYHLYTKHTERMVPSPYPNYDKPLSPLLPHIVDMVKANKPTVKQ